MDNTGMDEPIVLIFRKKEDGTYEIIDKNTQRDEQRMKELNIAIRPTNVNEKR